MPLKGAKKRSYNKKYYADNKERISEKKKEAYQEDLEKSRADSASLTRTSYDKDPESGAKSIARSKATYNKDLPKSREDSAVCSKASYDKDPESSAKSTARSKASYDKWCKVNC